MSEINNYYQQKFTEIEDYDNSDIEDPTYIPETDLEPLTIELELNNIVEESTTNSNLVDDSSKISRKRKRNPNQWKQNIRKKNRESGSNYTDIQGREHSAKEVKGACKNCRLNCSQKINSEDQAQIHSSFWILKDEEKSHFYSKFVERYRKKRNRPRHLPAQKPENSFKQYSFNYFFELNGEKIRVCKTFFLQTLNISSRRISYFFSKKYNHSTGVPQLPKRGVNRKRVTSDEKKNEVRAHIKSFPRVDSHYCRATTKREYLEPGLNLQKMYKLYTEAYTENPVKICIYRKIFNTEFNIDFHKPKKDRCDFCEEMKNKTTMSEEEISKHENHLKRKLEGREEKNQDKKIQNKEVAVISFDLENVFALPKANISNFFYKRKLAVYNLTAHCSINQKTYCAIWHEMICGRAGNHIASALIKILNRIIRDIPEIRRIILWSDSCIPQNKNSIMSFALTDFLKNNPVIESIEQKFSEPGHGNVQEVDAIHSLIERKLRFNEIFSPVSLLRCLKSLSGPTQKLILIQLKKDDFKDYQKMSKTFSYNNIPYTKLKYILLKSESLLYISYKLTFSSELITHKITQTRNIRKKLENVVLQYNIHNITLVPAMSKEKEKDLKSMYKYMPEIDKNFYNTILK